MTVKGYEWESDFAKRHRAEGYAEGYAEGMVRALLLVLESRDVAVSGDDRARLEGCTDLGQIERWVRRSVMVEAVEDLFA